MLDCSSHPNLQRQQQQQQHPQQKHTQQQHDTITEIVKDEQLQLGENNVRIQSFATTTRISSSGQEKKASHSKLRCSSGKKQQQRETTTTIPSNREAHTNSDETALYCARTVKLINDKDMTVRRMIQTNGMSIQSLLEIDRKQNRSKDDKVAFFHQGIDREKAEALLVETARTVPQPTGIFLLRECFSPNKKKRKWSGFSLSVFAHDRCYHYRVDSVADNIFSIEGKTSAIHGIDEFINAYTKSAHGLVSKLSSFCPGGSPPPDSCRKFGQDTLLHRSCSEGDAEVVMNILKAGYASKAGKAPHLSEQPMWYTINQRDKNGSTALHEASHLGREDIIRILLSYGALPSVIDAHGFTPIHRVAAANQPMLMRMLIVAEANIIKRNEAIDMDQLGNGSACDTLNVPVHSHCCCHCCVPGDHYLIRAAHQCNPYNMWLPIHDAAHNGSYECVRIMTEEYGLPTAPRTTDDVIPLELAMANNGDEIGNGSHAECINFLQNFRHIPMTPTPSSSATTAAADGEYGPVWLHGRIGRTQANSLLLNAVKGIRSGIAHDHHGLTVFLIRTASSRSIKNEKRGPTDQSNTSSNNGSENDELCHILSLACIVNDSVTCHFKIDTAKPERDGLKVMFKDTEQLFFISDGPYFKNLEGLVNHYSRVADGLPGCLFTPVNRDSEKSGSFKWSPEIPKRRDSNTVSGVARTSANDLQGDWNTVQTFSRRRWASCTSLLSGDSNDPDHRTPSVSPNPTFNNAYANKNLCLCKQSKSCPEGTGSQAEQQPRRIGSAMRGVPREDDQYQICRKQSNEVKTKEAQQLRLIPINKIQPYRLLGEGEFGCVWEGKYCDERGKRIGVAVKILKDFSDEGRREFLREALIMGQMNHQNVVKIYGIVNDTSLMMVQELLPRGSLLEYVRRNKVTDNNLKCWAAQIAQGMDYIQSKGFVHRDLAARNVLVASVYQVKVSDFGLSRLTIDNVYSQSSPGPIPVKWYAPEAIEYGRFTSKSDVWSYGVTLWEMFSGGQHPYGEKNGQEVLSFIKQDRRLERPHRCPISTYHLMLSSWLYDEFSRPSFSAITSYFQDDPDYREAIRVSIPGAEFDTQQQV